MGPVLDRATGAARKRGVRRRSAAGVGVSELELLALRGPPLGPALPDLRPAGLVLGAAGAEQLRAGTELLPRGRREDRHRPVAQALVGAGQPIEKPIRRP